MVQLLTTGNPQWELTTKKADQTSRNNAIKPFIIERFVVLREKTTPSGFSFFFIGLGLIHPLRSIGGVEKSRKLQDSQFVLINLRIQSAPQRKHNTSPLQRSAG
jgi:hypothetical protein